jgi:Uma2 family endonuclease
MTVQTKSAPTGKISYADFLAGYDDIHAEWVDGRIEIRESETFDHQHLRSFIGIILGFWVEQHEAGQVLSSPFQMYLQDQKCGREPDIMFVTAANCAKFKTYFLEGAADLIVEIISPESVGRDRGEKYVEYEAAGVREYWLIDPQRTQAEFYTLNDDQHYELIMSGKAGKFESRVLPGFYLQIEWLWQKPLPKVATILKDMGIL